MSLIIPLLHLALATANANDPVVSIAQAEREFAADSAALGINPAFVKHLSPDAWIFRPTPVIAGEWLKKQPSDGKNKLSWAPQYIEASRAGDMGVSIGPWRIDATKNEKTVHVYGHFMSIWQRGADGTWHVVADHGITHPEMTIDVPVEPLNAQKGIGEKSVSFVRDDRLKSLEAADDTFRHALETENAAAAYPRFTTTDAIVLSDGVLPKPGILPDLKSRKLGFGAAPRLTAGLSSDGSFGYTIGGSGHPKTIALGVYERVWRFDGAAWKLAADVTDSAQ